MILSCFPVLLVDTTDFAAQTEPDIPWCRSEPGRAGGGLLLESEESRAVCGQFFLQLARPCRMREIPCAKHINTLDAPPLMQTFQVSVFACGTGIAAMDVQVSDIRHWASS